MRRASPGLESLESRVVPSSLPLHVDGTRILDSLNRPVVLRGVNVAGMEWRPDGNHTMTAVDTALVDWKANLIRLPLNEDFWFGVNAIARWVTNPDDPGGLNYRALVDEVVAEATRLDAYVMLDLHWSDMDGPATGDGQHEMPDQRSLDFWRSVAARYANNPAVLFDPYNEPRFDEPQTGGEWNLWRDGGVVHEAGTTYLTPGMQGLIDAIRAQGANNIVAPEGLGWGVDLGGLQSGFALADPTGNLIYQLHLYPSAAFDDVARDALTAAVGDRAPIFIGEWGGTHNGGGAGSVVDPATWNQSMVAWLNRHSYGWTAWNMWAVTDQTDGGELPQFDLITDWNTLTPTADYGAIVKAGLNPPPIGNPPTIAIPPSASDAFVAGRSTTLNVLGADDGGEANLAYTWTTLGTPPAPVSFGENGDNAAKHVAVVFQKAGTYQFQVTIRDGDGLATTGSLSLLVRQTLSGLVVLPSITKIVVGTRARFSAAGLDQFGDPTSLPTPPRWTTTGGGSISRSGSYLAPKRPGTVSVTAVSGAFSAGETFAAVSNKPSASVAFRIVDDWGTGYAAMLTLTNTGEVDFKAWTLRFDLQGAIVGTLDGATLVGRSGNRYILRGTAASPDLTAGRSMTIAFTVASKGKHTRPAHFFLNGTAPRVVPPADVVVGQLRSSPVRDRSQRILAFGVNPS